MHRWILAALAVFALAVPAEAQRNCKKGKPCGNTCIAANRTCRVGAGSARSSTSQPTAAPAAVPADAQYVASSRGRVYYWIGCNGWKSLSKSNLRYFKSAEEARSAGYAPSTQAGCAGPDGSAGADSAAPPPPVGSTTSSGVCVVSQVVDGDTVHCADGEKIRLLLIDAPETDQGPYGPMAKLALEGLLPVGSSARIETDVELRDRYGRLLAYLYGAENQLVNEEMLRQGYAVVSVYPPNVKHVDRFQAAAKAAQDGRYGLWATSAFQCLPSDHRAGKCE